MQESYFDSTKLKLKLSRNYENIPNFAEVDFEFLHEIDI